MVEVKVEEDNGEGKHAELKKNEVTHIIILQFSIFLDFKAIQILL